MVSKADVNMVVMGGRLVGSPEPSTTRNGEQIIKFTMSNAKFKKNTIGGGFHIVQQYFRVHCFDKIAKEFIAAGSKKGDQLTVIGRLDQFVMTKKYREITENGTELSADAQEITQHINANQIQFFEDADYHRNANYSFPKTQQHDIDIAATRYNDPAITLDPDKLG
jgi:single-stranded DNA-binding protein